MPVEQVTSTVALEANRVYVIPPDRRLEITDSSVAAIRFEEQRGLRAPIDFFFRSLADQHGDGFAVVLPGGRSDGAVGVKAVKEAGGLVLVQDPAEAPHDSMPRAAIATHVADVVLPVRDLAGRLAELARIKRRVSRLFDALPGLLDTDEEATLGRILAHLRSPRSFGIRKNVGRSSRRKASAARCGRPRGSAWSGRMSTSSARSC